MHEPVWPGGADVENLALAQANAELERAGLSRRPVEAWERVEAGPFVLTALPAVDGLGDPQVSWLVEAEGQRVLHLGDTVFHGYWWRMARRHGPFDVVFAPINGAVVDFPHLQPPSPLAAAMEPEQAALAGELLGRGTVVPMHYGGYEIEPWYRPVSDAAERFAPRPRALLRGSGARARGEPRRGHSWERTRNSDRQFVSACSRCGAVADARRLGCARVRSAGTRTHSGQGQYRP